MFSGVSLGLHSLAKIAKQWEEEGAARTIIYPTHAH